LKDVVKLVVTTLLSSLLVTVWSRLPTTLRVAILLAPVSTRSSFVVEEFPNVASLRLAHRHLARSTARPTRALSLSGLTSDNHFSTRRRSKTRSISQPLETLPLYAAITTCSHSQRPHPPFLFSTVLQSSSQRIPFFFSLPFNLLLSSQSCQYNIPLSSIDEAASTSFNDCFERMERESGRSRTKTFDEIAICRSFFFA
jgi:hypothetical protein